ncbi:hypothetical protein JCM1840_006560 [Sporobolomyces johnsonii]
MPSKAELEAALARYPAALELRAQASKTSRDLVQLDSWYRRDLRDALRARMDQHEQNEAYLLKDELTRLMDWKLARGTWHPRLQSLIASNPPALVRSHTLLSPFPFPFPASAAASTLSRLSKLAGVGPATASGVLALWAPDREPFMSDEAMDHVAAYGAGQAGVVAKRAYTEKGWREFRDRMRRRMDDEGWGSMEELEMALWAWGVERKYGSKTSAAAADDGGAEEGTEGASTSKGKRKLTGAGESATKKRKST